MVPYQPRGENQSPPIPPNHRRDGLAINAGAGAGALRRSQLGVDGARALGLGATGTGAARAGRAGAPRPAVAARRASGAARVVDAGRASVDV